MHYIYILFLTLFLPVSVSAQQSAECATLEKEIRTDMQELGECWEDQDCLPHNFGCPWQHAVCHYTATSVEDKKKIEILEKEMASFAKQCPEKVKRCEVQIALACTPPRLMCVSGRCVTQGGVLLK